MANTASPAEEYFAEANSYYEKGEFEDASEMYKKAVNEGIENPILYYNYANSLFRTEQLGLSILYYEKALKLAPHDPDILANLKFARAHTVDKNEEPEQNILTKFLWYLHSGYSLNMALWIFLLGFSLIFALLILNLYMGSGVKIFSFSIIGLIALLLIIWSPSVIIRIKSQETARYAIVLSKSLDIYSGPGDNYQALAKVHEGTKFEIETITQDWAKVKLPTGKGGYVLASELGKI